MSAAKKKIRITTRLTGNPSTCRFSVAHSLHDGPAVFFRSKDDAGKSPLARDIFGVQDIEAVKISQDLVTVTRKHPNDWPSATREIAALITRQLESGKPAVEPGTPANMRSQDEIKEIAQGILDKEVNPSVASHGGEITILEVKNTTIYVKLGGGCHGCGMAAVTLKQGVERALRRELPELDEVLDVTDHAGGTNPYHAPSSK